MRYLICFCILLCLAGCGESNDRPPSDEVEKLVQDLFGGTNTLEIVDVTHVATDKTSDNPNDPMQSRFEFTVKLTSDYAQAVERIDAVEPDLPMINIIEPVAKKGTRVTGEVITSATFKLGRWEISLTDMEFEFDGSPLELYARNGARYMFVTDPKLAETKARYEKARLEKRAADEAKRCAERLAREEAERKRKAEETRRKAEAERQRQLAAKKERERIAKEKAAFRAAFTGDWISKDPVMYPDKPVIADIGPSIRGSFVRLRVPKGTDFVGNAEMQFVHADRPWLSTKWAKVGYKYVEGRDGTYFAINTVNLSRDGSKLFKISSVGGKFFPKRKALQRYVGGQNVDLDFVPYETKAKGLEAVKAKYDDYKKVRSALISKHNAMEYRPFIDSERFNPNTYFMIYTENIRGNDQLYHERMNATWWEEQNRQFAWGDVTRKDKTYTLTDTNAVAFPCQRSIADTIVLSNTLKRGEAGVIKVSKHERPDKKTFDRRPPICSVQLVEKVVPSLVWW